MSQALTFGLDNRTAVTDAVFAANPHLRTVGFFNGGCTGTIVAPNTVLTAAHCVAFNPVATSIKFQPAFTGVRESPADNAAHPIVWAKDYFLATPENDGYQPGNDWAIVHLDPATYNRGNTLSFPATLDGYGYMPIGLMPYPAAPAKIMATVLGYSWDFFVANKAPHVSTGSLVLDALCSVEPGKSVGGQGMLVSDIERNGTSSGGPIVQNLFNSGSAAIMATVGGGFEGNAPSWNQTNGNNEVSSAGFVFAPFNAGGMALVNDASGIRWSFASDLTWYNGVRFTPGQDPSLQHRPKSNWQDFRDAGTNLLTVYGRMGATRTTDNRMWVFATDSTGVLWNKRTTNAGSTWGNWAKWFPAEAIGQNVFDTSATASGTTTIRVFVLHSNGSVEARRKSGGADSAWGAVAGLGTPGGTSKGIASSSAEGLQQVFVATSTGIRTRQETAADQWSAGWSDFSDGALGGLTLVDVAAGHDRFGKMMVAILARQGTETVIWTRTKVGTTMASGWGTWTSWLSSANANALNLKGATQVQMAQPTAQTTHSNQSIFFIGAAGGMHTAKYSDPSTFQKIVPYYAPFTPSPLPTPTDPGCRAPITDGTRVPGAAPTVGYTRSDGINSVLYRNSSSRLKEITLSGSWSSPPWDLTNVPNALTISSNPTAHIRADNASSVAYRASDSSIRELALVGGGWTATNASSAATPAGTATGNPASYLRSDNYSAIVYRTTTGRVFELSRAPSGSWVKSDLMFWGAPTVVGDPIGYVRSDRVNAVVSRRSNGVIQELSLAPGAGSWVAFDLHAGGPTGAAGQPRPFTRSDNVSSIVYRSSDGHVRQLSLLNGTWLPSDLSGTGPTAASDPVGFVGADKATSVVYVDTSGNVRELRLTNATWVPRNLTQDSATAPPAATAILGGYARSDGYSIVLFKTSDGHVHELSLGVGAARWFHNDLTNITGGVP